MSKQAGIGGMMKQAQRLQQQIGKLQEELNDREFSASAGGGVVVAVVNGKQQLLWLTIAKEVVDPNDIDSLQDLVTIAINQALESSQSIVEAEVGKLTGGLNLGGLFG